ncbi:MAG TPA: SusE domain-containing protein, partial [Flavobacterium sp.]|uniref:SusE domain-containing protein n=1 Tax=Flavobacterium sp. TaxID=239 RepID=UPI002ED62C11
NTALTVTWEKVSYGAPTVVTYTVQIAANDTEFAAPVDVTSSTSTYSIIDVAELNTRALELGLAPNVESSIDVRIKATTGVANAEPKYSDVITISVTPYGSLETPVVTLYLVGDATFAGWNLNNNNMPLFTDPKDNKKHYYTGYFTAGGFKLLEKIDSWLPAYGNDGTKAVKRTSFEQADPSSFPTPTAGYYTFEINIETLAYTIAPFTGSTATTYSEIFYSGSTISGDDNDWSQQIALTKSTFDSHIWKVSGQTLKEGNMKFHTAGWAKEWGDNGGNIFVEAGKYDIWLNDLDGRYTFIKVQ